MYLDFARQNGCVLLSLSLSFTHTDTRVHIFSLKHARTHTIYFPRRWEQGWYTDTFTAYVIVHEKIISHSYKSLAAITQTIKGDPLVVDVAFVTSPPPTGDRFACNLRGHTSPPARDLTTQHVTQIHLGSRYCPRSPHAGEKGRGWWLMVQILSAAVPPANWLTSARGCWCLGARCLHYVSTPCLHYVYTTCIRPVHPNLSNGLSNKHKIIVV